MPTYTPQQLLDHLHQLDIPSLFDPNLSSEERMKEIKVAKQKIRLLKKQVKQEIEVIKSTWDGRNTYQAQQERLHLAPFLQVEQLVAQIEIAINELGIRGAVDWRPAFGSVIVGSFKRGEWHILSPLDAIIWNAKETNRQIEEVQVLISSDQSLVATLNKRIKEKIRNQRNTAIICFLVATCLLLFIFLFLGNLRNSQAILSIGGLAVAVYVGGIVTFFESRSPDKKLEQQILYIHEHIAECNGIIRDLKVSLAELKTLYNELKQQALP